MTPRSSRGTADSPSDDNVRRMPSPPVPKEVRLTSAVGPGVGARRRGPRRGVLASGAASSRVLIPALSVAVDAIIVLASILLATMLRQQLNFLKDASDVDNTVRAVIIPTLLSWLVLLWLFGTYRPYQFSAGTEEYRNVINSSVVTAGLVGIGCYLFRYPLSRGYFVCAFAIGIPLLVLGRFTMRRALHAARRRGLFQHRVLVAGDALHIDEISTILARESWLGYQVVGALRAQGVTGSDETPRGFPYVGEAAKAADVAIEMRADALVIANGAFVSSVELRRAQWALESEHVQVIVVPSVTDVAAERVRVRPVAGLPLVHLEQPGGARASSWAKRAFDVAVGSLILIAFSPLMLITASIVRMSSKGPVLFRQVRVGRGGQDFAMLKFRSMVEDAETMLPQLASTDRGNEMLFKIADDPRVTRTGRWMRRFSVDELPQLFNVIAGEMSLIGPRPALRSEVSRYDADVSRRLRVRPGITGLWQVSGRSDLSWEETVRLDLFYVDNWSMLRDFAILARTLRAVVGSRGAY